MFFRLATFFLPALLLAAPVAPSNLTLTPSSNSVSLSWQDNSADESGFKVFRDGNIIATVGADVTSYYDGGLNSKEMYRYEVKATEDMAESRVSLNSPLNATQEQSPRFSWNMLDGVDSYTIMIRPLLENGIDPDWGRIIHTSNIYSRDVCDESSGICTYTPNIDISGNHVWWIQADGKWSDRGYFSVNGYSGDFALDDGMSGLSKGYGVWGNYKTIREETIHNADLKGYITTYHPDIAVSPRPTLFFISGWSRNYVTYDKYLKFLASHGYYVVHIYRSNPAIIQQSYPDILGLVEQAVAQNRAWMDLTKVGLLGHSYGAGATVWLGKRVFAGDKNWGSNGRFIFMTTPWLTMLTTAQDLIDYPENTKLLVQVSHDEVGKNGHLYKMDPRAIRAVYQLISIPDEDKDFVTIKSDWKLGYNYKGNHHVAYTTEEHYDLLDVLLINRHSHAMLNYVFEGDNLAKKVALGNGSIEQKTMKNGQVTLRDLEVSDAPVVYRLQSDYQYKCSTGWIDQYWKLGGYCDDVNFNGVIDALE